MNLLDCSEKELRWMKKFVLEGFKIGTITKVRLENNKIIAEVELLRR